MSATTIAFLNFKGGVGKTATTVNLAAALAHYHQQRVLIVDLDPQCNASFWLMPPADWKAHVDGGRHSSFQIFQDEIMGTHRFDFDKAVVRAVPRKGGISMISRLDILPAAVQLITIEDRIHQNKYARFFEFLYKALKPHYKDYDYIFFDCPPNVYSISKNALYAAENCVVPYVPDFLSLSGFQLLAEQIEQFNDRISGFKGLRRRASIVGLLASHYKASKTHDQGLNELEVTLGRLKSEGLTHHEAKLLLPPIRHLADVSESTNEHLPVILHKPNGLGAEDYSKLAKSFHQHFQSL
ncbi:chromosome partitioning protein [Prosthecobacter fusiformis]|uniref:Chromosome partitioning protein n=1 Tax=Prosthecobacter fusiformis TaxID=48464 RepID=A0A4R7S4S4_9BACT|nr:ParA family protein [Prosthecobacter fusiformis]TDU72859.1 chromosome partitioning protein [Prosthecobacter fusiformis]